PAVASQAPGAASNQGYTISFTAPAAGGVVTATAAVLTSSPDNIPADNTATSLVTVPATADVVAQLIGPTTALAGQNLTYTLTTSNNGPGLATAIGQALNLPAGLPIGSVSPLLLNRSAPTSVSGTVASYGTGAAAITYDAATGRLTLPAVASLASGASTAPLTLSYLAPANGNVNLPATAVATSASPDSNPANNTVGLTTSLLPATDVQVILTGTGQTQPGNLLTYGVTTYNNGPSAAPTVSTTVSLPTGLTTVQLNDQAATSVSNGVYTYPGGATYDSNNSGVSATSGLVTFPAQTNVAAGAAAAAVNTISFTLPAGYQGTLSTTATATVGGIIDFFPSNNTSTVQPRLLAAGSASNDLQVTLALGAGTSSTVPAGSPVSLVLTLTSPSAGSSILPYVQLMPGLASGTGTVTVSLGSTNVNASYDNVSGLLTLPAGLNASAGLTQDYTIAISQAPGSGPLVAIASATGSETDSDLRNNLAVQSLTITPGAALASTVSGPVSVPAGSAVSYVVASTATGLSAAASPAQTVTIPTTATNLLVNGVATAVPGNGVLTLPLPALLQPGSANTVTNTVSFAAPGAVGSSFAVVGSLAAAGPGTVAAATASQATAIANPAPAARNLVNTLQAPEGTTAAGPLPIAPLAAAAQGTAALASYTVLTLPDPAQGVLYLWNGSSNAAVTAGQVLAVADANSLRFQPTTGYVGNATFSYLATDNAGTTSNAALYLVPVGADTDSFYASTPTKASYSDSDVLAYVTDPNGALYTSAGQLYDAATGQLVNSGTDVSSGLASTGPNAVLAAAGAGPSQNPGNGLPAGVGFNPTTGQFFVADHSQLPATSAPATYYFNVVTTDLYGGTNTALAQFTLAASPLPVTLVQFEAQAQGRDAQLTWRTANEQNNDYFRIERSFDGIRFVAIGRQAGQGTKAAATTYAYTDLNAAAQTTGLVYYRLQQVDLNGASTYSPVRAVRFGAAELSVYPNPAGATAQLDLSSLPTGTYRFILANPLGQTVRETSLPGGLLHTLDLSDLAAGTYQVRLTGTAVNFTQRLVKQ
ncbi:MAG: T9SS type A sorting domain-containing protein, partial [Hymenobacter sp.]